MHSFSPFPLSSAPPRTLTGTSFTVAKDTDDVAYVLLKWGLSVFFHSLSCSLKGSVSALAVSFPAFGIALIPFVSLHPYLFVLRAPFSSVSVYFPLFMPHYSLISSYYSKLPISLFCVFNIFYLQYQSTTIPVIPETHWKFLQICKLGFCLALPPFCNRLKKINKVDSHNIIFYKSHIKECGFLHVSVIGTGCLIIPLLLSYLLSSTSNQQAKTNCWGESHCWKT